MQEVFVKQVNLRVELTIMAKTSLSLSVVMITRNEEKAVAGVIDDIKQNVPAETEILIVDSSSDRTADIARRKGARVLVQLPPKGYGPAMMRALTEASGDIVITLDADNTYPAEYIPKLVGWAGKGFEVINASRLRGKPKSMPWINYLANMTTAILASVLYGKWTTDLHSGMRMYRKKVLRELAFNPNGPALPVDLWLKPILYKYKTKEIFIPYKIRIGESKMNPLPGLYWTLRRIILTRLGKS